ncbi:sugar phosphate isomerase/epimerase family protein [Mucilaginibacter ginsenosidivorans]|uniref:Sugar phosphate isomerase/epimerase n=1 Tax=Mucilaginibacter ginsenosidivorans TaxID=398053 RepID=A0A5B8UR73_9SPHI|nr:sugar phosphate isomerase/epimerase [Mucilaginibacter ginsenosidivorans]QEC61560.1 sugar phosphate isomerase/epimerase [Mucilaginibacter ginsenosidivorans]
MQFQINFIKTCWGQKDPNLSFINELERDGYSGAEVNVCSTGSKAGEIARALKDEGLVFVAQQWLPPKLETTDQYIDQLRSNLDDIEALRPAFVNSHTGKDFFSFEDNCRVIGIINEFSVQSGIPVYHETHRGRFAFHADSLLPYLEVFKDLKLTADFSHWCVVSESLLQDQQEILEKIIRHVKYIHARIGHAQGAQVNNPSAPEWKGHLDQFFSWWDAIIDKNKKAGEPGIFICPEFGPVPYMPAEPFTLTPVASQDKVNDWMLRQLRSRYLQ